MKRRHWLVSLLSGTFLVTLFLVLSGVAIVWANGLKFDFKTGEIQQTSLIAVEDSLDQVAVTLNGKMVGSSTPLRLASLQPGSYTLEIAKVGYIPYRRVFHLNPGEAGVIKGVSLIAAQPLVTKLEQDITYLPIDAFDAGLANQSGELYDYNQLVMRLSTPIIQAHRYRNGYLYQTASQLRFYLPETNQDYLVYSAATPDLLKIKPDPNNWIVVVFLPDQQLLVDLSRSSAVAAN